jgi:hypothetical protein
VSSAPVAVTGDVPCGSGVESYVRTKAEQTPLYDRTDGTGFTSAACGIGALRAPGRRRIPSRAHVGRCHGLHPTVHAGLVGSLVTGRQAAMLSRVLMFGAVLAIVVAALVINLSLLDIITIADMKETLGKSMSVLAVTIIAVLLIVAIFKLGKQS